MTDVDSFEQDVRQMLVRRAADVVDDGHHIPTPGHDPDNGRTKLRPNHLHPLPRRPARQRPKRSLVVAVAAFVTALGIGGALTISDGDSGGDGSLVEATEDATTDETSTTETAIDANTDDSIPSDPQAEDGPGARPWLTMTPSIDQLPPGTLTDPQPVYSAPGEPLDVAAAYLAERLPDSEALRLDIAETELVDRYALVRWTWGDAGETTEGAAGWIYLLKADGLWRMAASTIDGIDVSSVRLTSNGIEGEITSFASEGLAVDLVDQTSGLPIDPSTGLLPEDDVRSGVGTMATHPGREPDQGPATVELDLDVPLEQFVLRVQTVGGTILSVGEVLIVPRITEADLLVFLRAEDASLVEAQLAAHPEIGDYRLLNAVDTAARYLTSYSQVPAVDAIWDGEAGLVAYEVSVTSETDSTEVVQGLTTSGGVLAAAKPATPGRASLALGEAPRFGESDGSTEATFLEFDETGRAVRPGGAETTTTPGKALVLVTETREVATPPLPISCQAPLGIPVPPNRVNVIDDLDIAPTPRDALQRFLDRPSPPRWRTGYIEFITADGAISYGNGDTEGILLIVIRVEAIDGGWGVAEWEIVGC